jgi:LemA protein
MITVLMVLLILGGFILVSLLWAVGVFNSFIHAKSLVDEGWSGIDVQLKRRYDLIPNLVATVKEYASHEKGIFEEVARARAAAIHAGSVEQKAMAEKGLSAVLGRLFAVAENYPTLKANENFLSLQKELSAIEHEIQLSRRYYNGTARNYNVAVQTFPALLVAKIGGFKSVSYFELDSSDERQAPKVQF